MALTKSATRAAVMIDLENLVYEYRIEADWNSAVDCVAAMLDEVTSRATVVVCVAVCDRSLARALAVPLSALGVRVHVHHGGADAADACLDSRLRSDVPPSCDLVVVGSGDHYFVESVGMLRARGMRVEVAAREGHISRRLRLAADRFIDLTTETPVANVA